MKHNFLSVAAIHLTGDWTIKGVVRQVHRLTELHFSNRHPDIIVAIDCSGIDGIDHSGFELLYAWMNCIRVKGLRPLLVNIPDRMRGVTSKERLDHGAKRVIDLVERACKFNIAREI